MKDNLVGKLLDFNPAEGTTRDGRKYERANATIRVTQSYSGHEETSEIPVSFFVTQYTSTGKTNPAWTSFQELKTYNTAQNVGIDAADTIRVTGCTISENNFVTRSGQLINGWQLRGSFTSRVTNMKEVASFCNDIFIMDMRDEIDRNGDTTGRLVIKGGLVQYNGKLDVIEYIVEHPDYVDYISRNWEVNQTVTIKGFIRITSVEDVGPVSESSWGEDIPETTTRFVRELIITKGDDAGKDEEFAYDPDDIKKAFNVRKALIEQMQVDAKNAQKAPAKPATNASKYSWE